MTTRTVVAEGCQVMIMSNGACYVSDEHGNWLGTTDATSHEVIALAPYVSENMVYDAARRALCPNWDA